MIDSEKQKLLDRKSKYLSIGITPGGIPRKAIPVPWERTGSAFNMRTPDIYLSEEDLHDDQILSLLDQYRVIGFYAFDTLQSYDILSRFPALDDIYLCFAETLTDLSVLETISDWYMLFIHGAKLKDLSPLARAMQRETGIHSYCLGLNSCQIEDISALTESGVYLYELLIWDKENPEAKAKWEQMHASVFRYICLPEEMQ